MALAIGSEVLVVLVDGAEEFGTLTRATDTGVSIRTLLGETLRFSSGRIAEIIDLGEAVEDLLGSEAYDEEFDLVW